MAKASWTTHPKVLGVRRRSAPANLLVRAMENFRNHRTGRNATLVAHFGFLSVFPLLLVFTTVLGFVLENNPELQQSIVGLKERIGLPPEVVAEQVRHLLALPWEVTIPEITIVPSARP